MAILLSASSIADFIRCPRKVLYRITKPFPEIPSREMLIGRSAHYIIEKCWSDREKATKLVEDETIKNKYTKKESTNLSFYIDIFFLNFSGYLKSDDKIEFSFKVPLYDDVFVVGKIDRISNATIFDWKTGRTSKNLQSDVQCMIYDFAYTTIYNKKPNGVCIASLAEGTLIPYREDELYVKEVFDNIIPRMIRTLRAKEYERLGLFNHSCFRCQYKQGCLGDTHVVDSLESS